MSLPTHSGDRIGTSPDDGTIEATHGKLEDQSIAAFDLAPSSPRPGLQGDLSSSLRWRITQEHQAYERKLLGFQEAQQRQALLVQRLQAKVVQYKTRCGNLEKQLLDKEEAYRHLEISQTMKFRHSEGDQAEQLENALIRLEEEQRRCTSLAEINALLRDQLNQSNAANQVLSVDLRKLTEDWTLAREELETKESDWRREEEIYNKHVSKERIRMLSLWKATVSLRQHFIQIKSATDRDLAQGRVDLTRLTNTLHSAVLSLGSTFPTADLDSRDRMRRRLENLEQELKAKDQETQQIRVEGHAQRAELQARNAELSLKIGRLESHLSQKERMIHTLMEESAEAPEVRELRSTVEEIGISLARIAQTAISEAPDEDSQDTLLDTRSLSPSRGPKHSPSLLSETLSAIQAGLQRKCSLLKHLRESLAVTQEQSRAQEKELAESREREVLLEARITETDADGESLRRRLERVREEADRVRQENADLRRTGTDHSQTIASLRTRLRSLTDEVGGLRDSNVQLKGEFERLQVQFDDVNREKELVDSKKEQLQKVLEQSECQVSELRRDISTLREELGKTGLEWEIAMGEVEQLRAALVKCEQMVSDLTRSNTSLHTQELNLRDSLAKTCALNEAMSLDKVELNAVIQQLEREGEESRRRAQALEQRSLEAREASLRAEEVRRAAEGEAQRAAQALRRSELEGQRVRAETSELRELLGHLREQEAQTTRLRAGLTDELQQTHHKLQAERELVIRTKREMEAVSRDKAALEVQLSLAQRDMEGLSSEIQDLRLSRDNLEMSLFSETNKVSHFESLLQQSQAEIDSFTQAKNNLQDELHHLRSEQERQVGAWEEERERLRRDLSRCRDEAAGTLDAERRAHRDQVEQMEEEQRALHLSLEEQRLAATEEVRRAAEEATAESHRERERLLEAVSGLRAEREEILAQSATERQQALSELGRVNARTLEELSVSRREVAALEEAIRRVEQERNDLQETITSLSTTLDQTRADLAQLEDARSRAEGELREERNRLEVERGKEITWAEELEARVAAAEEGRREAWREMRAAADEAQALRRALGEARGQRDEAEGEGRRAAEEAWWEARRGLEAEKVSLQLQLEETQARSLLVQETNASLKDEAEGLRRSLREVERERLEGRREMQELRRKLKMLEADLSRSTQDLEAQRASAVRRDQEALRELGLLRTKVAQVTEENEVSLLQAREGERRAVEAQGDVRVQLEDLRSELEQLRGLEKARSDEASQLGLRLECLSQTEAKLRLELSAALGRAQALSHGLAKVDTEAKKTRSRLGDLLSTLRQSLGLPAGLNPEARRSESDGVSTGEDSRDESLLQPIEGGEVVDLEVEAVEAAVRGIQERESLLRKERDSLRAELRGMGLRLEQLEAERSEGTERLQKLRKKLAEAEEGWRDTTDQLNAAQATVRVQEHALGHQERETAALRETIGGLERSLRASHREVADVRERLRKAKEARLEWEVEASRAQDELGSCRAELSQSGLSSLSLEGELMRCQAQLSEREREVAGLRDEAERLRDRESQGQEEMQERMETELRKVEEETKRLRARAEDGEAQNLKLQSRLQEKEVEVERRVSDLQKERTILHERVSTLQRAVAELEKERGDAQARFLALEKDRRHMRRALEKTEKEKELMLADRVEVDQIRVQLQESLTMKDVELESVKGEVQRLKGENETPLKLHTTDVPLRSHRVLENEIELLRLCRRKLENSLTPPDMSRQPWVEPTDGLSNLRPLTRTL